MLILRHAWLNPRDKHMTTGRINQVAADTGPSTLAAPGHGRRLAAADGRAARVAQHFALVANGRLHGTKVSQLFGTTAPPRTARKRRPCYGRPPSARRRASAAPVLGGPKGPAPGLPRALRHARSSGARTIGCGWLLGGGLESATYPYNPFLLVAEGWPQNFF